MRQARLNAPEDHPFAYYHVISRVVNREFALGDDEREQFVEMMRCYANNLSLLPVPTPATPGSLSKTS